MVNKVLVSSISIILVIGVVLGVVAVVRSPDKKPESNIVSTSNKVVEKICSKSDDKTFCKDTLGQANNSNDPMEYIKYALQSGIDHHLQLANSSYKLSVENKDNAVLKLNFGDCSELLQFAVEDFQTVLTFVKDNNPSSLEDQMGELINRLSAVVAFQETCVDVFAESRHPLKDLDMYTARKLIHLSLELIHRSADILLAFGLKLNAKPAASRRLLSTEGQGYPTWLSMSDRKLLAEALPNATQTNEAVGGIIPDVIVAKDGSGQFLTIGEALLAYPKEPVNKFIIYVKEGVYDEYITVGKNLKNIYMYGDGPRKTIVTGNKNRISGVQNTWKTASFSVVGDGFMCKDMGFENTAGPIGEQAVALRVQSNHAAFFNCRVDGFQDTLYLHAHRSFFRDCVITGTIDFIFGDSATVIQNSQIIVRKPGPKQSNTVTAQGRDDNIANSALVIQNCSIIPEEQLIPERFLVPSYLGRPWKNLSTTIIMESFIDDFIRPEGWLPWNGNDYLDTLYYAEYANVGPGADISKRVQWKGYHVIDKEQARRFTIPFMLLDTLSYWIQATGFPYNPNLTS